MGEYFNWDGEKWVNENRELKYDHLDDAVNDMVGWQPSHHSLVLKKLTEIEHELIDLRSLIEQEKD